MINYELLVLDPFGKHLLLSEDMISFPNRVFYKARCDFKRCQLLKVRRTNKVDFRVRLNKFLKLNPPLSKRWVKQ